MIQDRNLNREERKEFCSRYLKYRNAGETVKESFRLAEIELKAEGLRAPTFGCLRNWIAKGVPECPEIDMGKVRGIPRAADAAEDKPDTTDKTDNLEAAEDVAEDVELLKLLIKAYRLRSEKTIDDLVDHLLPELFEEE